MEDRVDVPFEILVTNLTKTRVQGPKHIVFSASSGIMANIIDPEQVGKERRCRVAKV